MSELTPKKENTGSKEVFIDFLMEIVGYEKGMYRTFIDLRKQPKIVLKSYLNKENIYVSPFKILIYVVGIWLVFNKFIIDWYKIFGSLIDSAAKTGWLKNHDKSEPMPADLLYNIRLMTKIMSDLFSKYYMAFVILGTPFWAYVCLVLCRPYKIDFRTHIAVVGYHFSLGFIPAFIFIGLFAINIWLSMFVAFIIVISPLVGLRVVYNKVFVIVPVSSFFEENGLSIEKKYYRARIFMTFIFILIYFFISKTYYSIYPI